MYVMLVCDCLSMYYIAIVTGSAHCCAQCGKFENFELEILYGFLLFFPKIFSTNFSLFFPQIL